VFQTAKNGVEFSSVRRRNVAVTVAIVVSFIEKMKLTLLRFLAPSVKQRMGLEKESRISWE